MTKNCDCPGDVREHYTDCPHAPKYDPATSFERPTEPRPSAPWAARSAAPVCPGCGVGDLMQHRQGCQELKKSIDEFNSRPHAVPGIPAEPPSKGSSDVTDRLILKCLDFCAGVIAGLSEENGRLKEVNSQLQKTLEDKQAGIYKRDDEIRELREIAAKYQDLRT